MLITSRDNSLLRQARAVRDGKIKELIFVEGLRLCEEALRSSLPLEAVIFSNEIARKPRVAPIIAKLVGAANRAAEVGEKLLESISFTKTPQGVVVLAQRPESNSSLLLIEGERLPLLVVMHEINNPVNVGAIIRTAEGAGATGAITTSNTSDPFSPKSLRGAMGSAFRLPIWHGPAFEEVIEWCDSHKIQTICADAASTMSFTDVDWTKPRALILGRESIGLSEEEMRAADHSVRIPMQGSVESLNVAVAAGVLLYEAARQRAKK
ncbi:MAG TPA: RNA methyltransferase [Pyrinomonadaceae bacterium]